MVANESNSVQRKWQERSQTQSQEKEKEKEKEKGEEKEKKRRRKEEENMMAGEASKTRWASRISFKDSCRSFQNVACHSISS